VIVVYQAEISHAQVDVQIPIAETQTWSGNPNSARVQVEFRSSARSNATQRRHAAADIDTGSIPPKRSEVRTKDVAQCRARHVVKQIPEQTRIDELCPAGLRRLKLMILKLWRLTDKSSPPDVYYRRHVERSATSRSNRVR
jgi:hypothetical protein